MRQGSASVTISKEINQNSRVLLVGITSAVRPRKQPYNPRSGSSKADRQAPMAFSFGGLDIRHRLPDAKRSRELLKAPGGAHLSIEVSTPQNGAYPFQLHHRTYDSGWQWHRTPTRADSSASAHTHPEAQVPPPSGVAPRQRGIPLARTPRNPWRPRTDQDVSQCDPSPARVPATMFGGCKPLGYLLWTEPHELAIDI